MQAIRGHTEDRVASVAKTSLSIDEYRSRLVAIYSMHNPSNVEKVDYLLSKYKEKENLLYDSVCAKYHIPDSWDGQQPLDAELKGQASPSDALPVGLASPKDAEAPEAPEEVSEVAEEAPEAPKATEEAQI